MMHGQQNVKTAYIT